MYFNCHEGPACAHPHPTNTSKSSKINQVERMFFAYYIILIFKCISPSTAERC